MDRRHVELLKAHAATRGCSQAAVVRELIEDHLGRLTRSSLYDQARDLCGCVDGPKDLSIRKLKGYGRDQAAAGHRPADWLPQPTWSQEANRAGHRSRR